MNSNLQIKQGKRLTRLEIDLINETRKQEFNSTSLINPKPDNDDWEKKYFLLKDQHGKMLAFARLHETEVEFKGKKYPLLGLATLIAIQKGKGYGKKLVLKIKRYIEKKGITSIGFCNKKLTKFYKKCGFGIIVDGTSKTLYIDGEGNRHSDKWGGGDAIYVKGKDKLINEILANPKENIFIFRPHW